MRCTEIKRETKETQIQLQLNLAGSGVFQGSSGIGFFRPYADRLCRAWWF